MDSSRVKSSTRANVPGTEETTPTVPDPIKRPDLPTTVPSTPRTPRKTPAKALPMGKPVDVDKYKYAPAALSKYAYNLGLQHAKDFHKRIKSNTIQRVKR